MISHKKSSSNQETSPPNSFTNLINGNSIHKNIGLTENDSYEMLLLTFTKFGVKKWVQKFFVSASMEGIVESAMKTKK